MPDPLAPLSTIPQVFQDTDGPLIETTTISSTTYRLGSGLTGLQAPAYSAGAPLIPKGAGPYPTPNAPTAGATFTTGNLVTNGHYKWTVTLVTDWGETPLDNTKVLDLSAGIGSGVKGQTINLPGWVARLDNPVRMRRLYRTIHTGSQFLLVAEIDDASETSYVDEVPDEELTVPIPTTDTSGFIGSVDVYDGTIHWTEVAYTGSAPTVTHTFSVDYSVITGGFIHFASVNIGASVTITYHAGTLLGSLWMNQYQTAIKEVYDYFRNEVGSGEPHFSHNLQINQNLTVLGTSTLTGNTTVGGTLGVTGATTLAGLTASTVHATSTLQADGNTTLGGTLSVTSGGTTLLGLTVTGTGTITTLHTTGTSALDGAVTMGATASVAGNFSVGGTATIANLGVTGSTTLTGSLTANSTVTLNSGLNVASGNVGLNNNLTVTGTTTLNGPFISNGTMTLNNGLNVAGGNASFNGTVTVTGATTLNNTLTVNGLASFPAGVSGSTTFNNDVSIPHTLHLLRLAPDQGSAPSLSDLSPGATTLAFVGTCTDMAGIVHFKPGGSSAAGDQFQVTYNNGSLHSPNPIVIFSQRNAATSHAVTWYTSLSNATSFIASAQTTPTAGDDYFIGYLVVF